MYVPVFLHALLIFPDEDETDDGDIKSEGEADPVGEDAFGNPKSEFIDGK